MADRQPLPGQSVLMTNQQFKGVITQLKEASLDRVLAIRSATFEAIHRLGVARDTSKNWKGNPGGSHHFDSGTLLAWIKTIHKGDGDAIDQLIVIDATCCERGT